MKKIMLLLTLVMIGLTACYTTYYNYNLQNDYTSYIEIEYENYETDEDYEIDNYEDEYNDYYDEEILTSFEDDAIAFIELIESTHPIFVMPEFLADDYYDRRDEFIRAVKDAESQMDFNFALQRFDTVLRDGHTSIRGFALLSNYYLDMTFVADDNSLFLADSEVVLEIMEIGGVPTATVLETIDRYFYYENEVARNLAHAVMGRGMEILIRAGVEFEYDITTLTLDNGEMRKVQAVEDNAWLIKGFVAAADREFIIDYGMITDDVFLIDLRAFIPGAHINSAENAIRRAMDDGVRHFVFDVRNNTGGNAAVGAWLLDAMGITPPSFGSVVRSRSALNPDQEIASLISPSLRPTRNPYDVTIAVLTNANTLSSARWVSAWVQDGELGVIIGEPGANAPTAFGNVAAQITLPHSGMHIASSTNRWIRPDAYADQNTIWPDIYVPYSEALEAALEFFAGLD